MYHRTVTKASLVGRDGFVRGEMDRSKARNTILTMPAIISTMMALIL
jgi:hypothetical protein